MTLQGSGLCLVLALLLSGCAAGGGPPPTADAAPPGRGGALVDEPVFGGQVYVAQSGQGNPEAAVLIHGLGPGASDDWAGLIPHLAERFHVVAFDLPGFGRSSGGNRLYSPAAYARLVHWLAERYARGPVTVLGHSLGAAVALRYAANHPEAVRRLVLADVAGILHRVSFLEDAYRIESAENGGEATIAQRYARQLNGLLRRAILRLDRVPLAAETVLASAGLRRLILGGDPGAIAAMALIEDDFGPILGAVRAPVRLIWGGQDQVAPLRTARVLLHAIPDARLEVIDDAGHAPMFDRPAAFHQAVLDALSARSGLPRPPRVGVEPDRGGWCLEQDEVSFEGVYGEITVEGCRRVRIRGVSARSIRILRSDATIEDTTVVGGTRGLVVTDSNVIATALTVRAETALEASRSHLDLAGVTLVGSVAAARSPDRVVLVFSVSRIESPRGRNLAHGVHYLTARTPL